MRPVSFLYPLKHRLWERIYVGARMFLYDELGGHKGLRRHRHLTKRQALKLAPALASDSLIGAVQYDDCQVDDARHTLAVARTAARFGAAVANSMSVITALRGSFGSTSPYAVPSSCSYCPTLPNEAPPKDSSRT